MLQRLRRKVPKSSSAIRGTRTGRCGYGHHLVGIKGRTNPESSGGPGDGDSGCAPGPTWLGRDHAASNYTVCVAGAHGKTTDDRLVAACWTAAGIDPTGDQWRDHPRLWLELQAGESDWYGRRKRTKRTGHCEAAQSDLRHRHEYDPEAHGPLRLHGTSLPRSFDTFGENLPFYGFAVSAPTHPESTTWPARVTDRRRIPVMDSPAGPMSGPGAVT